MSAPAPASQRVRAQAGFETLTFLRNGEQLLVGLILPAMALVGLTVSPFPDLGTADRINVIAPGVLALAVVSSAFTGQAISTAFDRRYGVLRMYGVSPLGRDGLLTGKFVAIIGLVLLQVAVLGGIALAMGWRPTVAGVLPAAIGMLLGIAAFIGLALLLAGTLRAEAVLAVANLLWVVFLGIGLVLPVATLPSWLELPARLLPSGALGEAMRGALLDGGWPLSHWLVLAVWAVGSWALALRVFRWAP